MMQMQIISLSSIGPFTINWSLTIHLTAACFYEAENYLLVK